MWGLASLRRPWDRSPGHPCPAGRNAILRPGMDARAARRSRRRPRSASMPKINRHRGFSATAFRRIPDAGRPLRCWSSSSVITRTSTIPVNAQQTTPGLAAEDRDLVNLLRSVLVDPNVHTDLRMRLHREIRVVLSTALREMYGRSAGPERADATDGDGGRLADLLRTVLVDPNLYTDLRMRLHREIRTVLSWAHAHGSA
jgi:hypothetical protein